MNGHFLRRAFTLIELLVVISIIALLAAILFPVFGRARESARRSACQSNLKQFSMGWMQYAQDYDEMTAPYRVSAGSLDSPTNPGMPWADTIMTYVKNSQVLICPSQQAEKDINGTTYARPGMSYSYNMVVSSYGPGQKIAAIQSASTMVLFADAVGSVNSFRGNVFDMRGGTGITARVNYGTYYQISRTALPAGARHMDGANYAFVDGHVKWYHCAYSPVGYQFAGPTAADRAASPPTSLDFDGDGQPGTATAYD
jgi:prepilin-type N-terminal cleavage/methylation domain-containing protein/prepilin-type processing-associated H-X9-DG protein